MLNVLRFARPRTSLANTVRHVHLPVVEKCRESKTGEFTEELNQYKVLIVRESNLFSRRPLIGPATVAFEGIPIETYGQKGRGVAALQNVYGVRTYLANACSGTQDEDNDQPYITLASAMYLYAKYLESGRALPRGEFHFNETELTDLSDCVACIFSESVKNESANLREVMEQAGGFQKKTAGQIAYYKSKEGRLYHVDNNANLSPMEMPANVFSLANMKRDPQMRKLARELYEEDLDFYAGKFERENNGQIPQKFCFPFAQALGLFREDLQSKIDQRRKEGKTEKYDPEALRVTVKPKKVKPIEANQIFHHNNNFISNH